MLDASSSNLKQSVALVSCTIIYRLFSSLFAFSGTENVYLNENHLRQSKLSSCIVIFSVLISIFRIMKFANERDIIWISGKNLRAARATAHWCYCSDVVCQSESQREMGGGGGGAES